jgi:hypothetical protein
VTRGVVMTSATNGIQIGGLRVMRTLIGLFGFAVFAVVTTVAIVISMAPYLLCLAAAVALLHWVGVF